MNHFNPSKVRGSWKKIAATAVSSSETISTWSRQVARPTANDYLKNTWKYNLLNQPQLSPNKFRQLFKSQDMIEVIVILESNVQRLSTMLPIEWCSTSLKKRSSRRLTWLNLRSTRWGRNCRILCHHLNLPMRNYWFCTNLDEKWSRRSIENCNPLFCPLDPKSNPKAPTPIIAPIPHEIPCQMIRHIFTYSFSPSTSTNNDDINNNLTNCIKGYEFFRSHKEHIRGEDRGWLVLSARHWALDLCHPQ